MPFAIVDGVTVAAEPAEQFLARALDLHEDDGFEAQPASGWRAFVRGVIAELGYVPPARIEISGTLPRGAGLGSSAALSVALCLALGGERDRMEIARLCSRVENRWVGARTGLLDQIASLFGRRGHALRIDFSTLDVEPVPLRLGDWRLVIVDSGETRTNAAAGYNERRSECEEACRLLGIDAVSKADPDALPAPLDRRARHVVEENARVADTVEALRRDDLAAVGGLLNASHSSLRDNYEVSTPAVERTVEAVRDAGAAGARVVGGGFGGHVLALFPPGVEPPPAARPVTPSAGARLKAGEL